MTDMNSTDFSEYCFQEFLDMNLVYDECMIAAESSGQREQALNCIKVANKMLPFAGVKTESFGKKKVGHNQLNDHINCFIPHMNWMLEHNYLIFYASEEMEILYGQCCNYIYVQETKEDGRWSNVKTVKIGEDCVDALLHNLMRYYVIEFEENEINIL
jgi:hypothetical protein